MNNIGTSRPSFFPNSRNKGITNKPNLNIEKLQRNSLERTKELKHLTKNDAKVDIGQKVKDFSRIKKAAMAAPDIDNSDKIASIKAQIQNGTYNVNYEQLADKILESEF